MKKLLFLLFLLFPSTAKAAIGGPTGGGGSGGSSVACTKWAPGAISQAFVAGTTYCPNAVGTYTFAAAANVNVDNVTIYCSNKGMVLQRTGTTDLFDLSGVNDQIIGCSIDGNSQSAAGTGPLVNISGTNDVATNLYFTNTGTTNPTTGTVNIQSGSVRPLVTHNTFAGTQADQAISVNFANTGASAIVDGVIGWNQIPTFNPGGGTMRGIIGVDNSGSAPIQGLQVIYNQIGVQGSNAEAIDFTGGNIAPNTASHRNFFIGNQIKFNGTSNYGMKIFAMGRGTVISNNLIDENGFVGVHAFVGGDIYSSLISNNTDVDGGLGNAFECDDCGQDVFTGNSITGIGSSNDGIALVSVGGTSTHSTSNNIVQNNFVSQSGASTCYLIDVSGSGNADSNQFLNNTCLGTGAVSELGLQILQTSGTNTNVSVQGNGFTSIATGVSVSGATLVDVLPSQHFASVTTHYSGLAPAITACGTGSPAATGTNYAHVVTAGGGALASCTDTFAHSGWAVAPTCTAIDVSHPLIPLGVSATATVLTITGSSITNDVINVICQPN